MSRPSAVGLVVRQARYQNRIFWRTPVAAFFTLVLPLIMLVLFVALFGNDELDDTIYGFVRIAQFYTPGLAVFSAASATFTNIGINLSTRRDLGVLKRVRGTPIPPGVYLAGVVVSAVWVALLATVVMVGVGVVAYDVNIELAKLPAMALAFVVGAATFAMLGVTVAAVAKTSQTAQSLTQATLLPLAFVSDVFISLGGPDDSPAWLEIVGDIFPLKHFVQAFGIPMSPASEAPAFESGHLAVLVAWLALGAVVSSRRFRWEPMPGATAGRRHRSRSASPGRN
ncbi:MAG: ABC transporter permease [Acidimicrobiales bacterium]